MSEMVERVAKAIFEERYKAPGTHQFLPWEQYANQEIYRADARAALAVMREPTNEMHKAMCECYNSPVCIWMTGIDAALGKVPA